jgi:hypothetical protein
MKINKIIVLLSITLMISIPGHARYKAASINRIDTINTQINTLKDESVSFNYKIFNANDCKKYFNSRSIINKGYQPIQIIFTNNSNNTIAISPDSFSFRCAHVQDVTNSLHRDGMARGIGFGLGALWFLPLIFPALIQGLGAAEYNEEMDIDFANKALKNQVVPPYTTVNGVIFACRNEFSKKIIYTFVTTI